MSCRYNPDFGRHKQKQQETMSAQAVSFSIVSDAAWAPGVETREAWLAWANHGFRIDGSAEPPVRAMPAMQRRRAGLLGKMALQVAYECLGERMHVPTVFCSRHGEVSRSVELLGELAKDEPLSPMSFGLSVHNAAGGLFSIARGDQSNNMALSARRSTVEHGVIEACGLLADGEQAVLLVAYDRPLPPLYAHYQDCDEQAYAWAWLIEPPRQDIVSLAWSTSNECVGSDAGQTSPGLDILRFHLRGDQVLQRRCGKRVWHWSRHG
jgi:hypothetical protein